jgi:hypothetical protein
MTAFQGGSIGNRRLLDIVQRRRRRGVGAGSVSPELLALLTQGLPGEGSVPPAFQPAADPTIPVPRPGRLDPSGQPVNQAQINAVLQRNAEATAAQNLRERRRQPFLGVSLPDTIRDPQAGSLTALLQLAATTPGFNVPFGTGPFVAQNESFSLVSGGPGPNRPPGNFTNAPQPPQPTQTAAARPGGPNPLFGIGPATIQSMARLGQPPQSSVPATSSLRT